MAKVLLVEDDNNLREIYEARLQAEGYETVTASDGEQALVVAKDAKPDLVISDVMMPKISGFEMLDILRNTDGLKDVKVIMLTALGQSEDKTRADQLGADKYLVKSQVTLEDIVKTAHQLLDEESAPAPVATDSTPATETTSVETPEPATTVEPTETAPTPAVESPEITPVPATDVTPEPTVVAPADPVGSTTEEETEAMQAQITSFAEAPATAPEIVTPEPATTVEPTETAPTPAVESPEITPVPATDVTPEPTVVAPADPVGSTPEEVAATAHDDDVMAAAVDSLTAGTEAQKPSDVTAVEVAPPAPITTPAAPVTEPATEDAESDGVTIGHKKVISPISDVAAKPDINQLLAAEEAAANVNAPVPVAPAAATVVPTPETPVTPATVVEPPVDPTKPNPNDIAL